MFLVSELEAVSTTGVFQRCCTIDEKHGVLDVVFLTELRKEPVRENLFPRPLKRCMEQFVRVRIDRGVQPVALVIELNYGLVDRNVIRISTTFWLWIGLVNPGMDSGPGPFNIEYIENINSI